MNQTAGLKVHQYEVFTSYLLPWGIGARPGWQVVTKVNGAAGALHADRKNGFIASAGPGVGVRRGPFELDGGISAAFLSEDTFSGRDLNGMVQFISHVGINLRLLGPVGVGYNFQHMSNAHMNGRQNPGINMHMVSLIWYLGR